MKPYGLILAGGGAKGAYQIGAWKAMRELDIEFEAIAGASIGAINGAMIAQGDFDDAYELWSNVEVSSGVNIQGERLKLIYRFVAVMLLHCLIFRLPYLFHLCQALIMQFCLLFCKSCKSSRRFYIP